MLRRLRPDIALPALARGRSLEVPVAPAANGLRREDAVLRDGFIERRREAAVEKIGIGRLQSEGELGGHYGRIRKVPSAYNTNPGRKARALYADSDLRIKRAHQTSRRAASTPVFQPYRRPIARSPQLRAPMRCALCLRCQPQ